MMANGKAIIPEVVGAIVLASVRPAEVGYAVLPLNEVIDLP